jgi:hypothetical protein
MFPRWWGVRPRRRTSICAGATVAAACTECFGHGGRGESNLVVLFHNVITGAGGPIEPRCSHSAPWTWTATTRRGPTVAWRLRESRAVAPGGRYRHTHTRHRPRARRRVHAVRCLVCFPPRLTSPRTTSANGSDNPATKRTRRPRDATLPFRSRHRPHRPAKPPSGGGRVAAASSSFCIAEAARIGSGQSRPWVTSA